MSEKKTRTKECNEFNAQKHNSNAFSTSWTTLKDVMNRNAITIGTEVNIVEAAKQMSDRSISCMVVAENDEILGIITETDFTKKVITGNADYATATVGQIMSSPIVSLCETVGIDEASSMMQENRVKRLPVTSDGKLVGIVTQTDLIQTMVTHIYNDIDEMMTKNVATIEHDVTAADAAKTMTEKRISCIVVTRQGKVAGVITERDMVKKIVAVEKNASDVTVDQIMASPVISVPSDYSAFSTSKIMEAKGLRRILVMDGEKLCGILTQTDIFRTAKALLDEQKKHSLIQSESSGNGICEIRSDGVVVYANPAFTNLLQVEDVDEIVGMNFLPEEFWVNPDDYHNIPNQIQAGELDVKELPLKTKTGKTVNVAIFFSYERNVQNQIENIKATIYDISKRKELAAQHEMEQALLESEERFRILMENIPGIAIQGYQTDGTVFYWNYTNEQIFGYTAGEAIGKNIIDLIATPELKGKFKEGFEAGKRAEKSGQFQSPGELTLRHKDGQAVPVHAIHTVVRIEGKEPLLFQIDVDLTENKRVEQELRLAKNNSDKAQKDLEVANKKLEQTVRKANSLAHEAVLSDLTKSKFLASMSHEIRTPLNAIIGLSEVLAEEELNDEQINHLSVIRDSAQKMLILINDILDFSRIEAGNFDLEVGDCSLEQLLAVIESLMRPQVMQKNLDFGVFQKSDLPTTIRTDPLRLRQCLMNLINNSIDCTENGHIYVNVSLKDTEGTPLLQFDIEDTGYGLTPEEEKNIFKDFNNDDTSRSKSGTGLSLAITKNLANLMNGDVTFVSEYGKGSTFTLVVPAGVDVKSQPIFNKYDRLKEAVKPVPKETPKLSGRILVAEDTPTNQTLITLLLKKQGLEAVIAEDGQQAVEKALNQPFDLILMDIQMPNKNGYDATRELRNLGFKKPIIAVTAHAMKGDREKCIAAGCDDYVSKPIDKKELIRTLDKYLNAEDELAGKIESTKTQINELTDMCEQTITIDGDAATEIPAEIDYQNLIDYKALTELCDDKEVINEVVQMYLKDSPRCIKSLAEAIKENNPKHIRMYAHSLKGASLQIGATTLGDVAFKLECAGRDKKVDEVPELFNKVQDEYSKLKLFLSREDWLETARQASE